jgi:hypothetical protein
MDEICTVQDAVAGTTRLASCPLYPASGIMYRASNFWFKKTRKPLSIMCSICKVYLHSCGNVSSFHSEVGFVPGLFIVRVLCIRMELYVREVTKRKGKGYLLGKVSLS